MTQLLKKMFWYARIPQIIAITALISSALLYLLLDDTKHIAAADLIFIGLWVVTAGYIAWSELVWYRQVILPVKQAMEAFSTGIGAFPELSRALMDKEDAGSFATSLSTVFQYLNDNLALYRQQLKEARDKWESANKAKDAFIANMSHELRTPLNAITGFCEMLGFTTLSTKQKEYLEYMHSAAQTLLAIVNELLDLSAVAQGRLKIIRAPFNFYKVLQDAGAAFERQAKEKGLQYSMRISPKLPRYFVGDNNKLRQVVSNLLNNAVRFTEKGHIELAADFAGADAEGVIKVRISVTDTGIGVPEDKREIIFERFMQADSNLNRKYGGTGLGLAICRELLDLMNGHVTYESNTPAGSRFIVELPLELAHMAAPEIPEIEQPAAPPVGQPLRALVVEDDPSSMALAREFLNRADCRLLTAGNGFEAINLLQKEHVDIVLLDISMPVMEGIETITLIRQMENKHNTKKPLFVAAITANAMRGDEQKYLQYGFNKYIPKPISYNNITELLSQYAEFGRKYTAHTANS